MKFNDQFVGFCHKIPINEFSVLTVKDVHSILPFLSFQPHTQPFSTTATTVTTTTRTAKMKWSLANEKWKWKWKWKWVKKNCSSNFIEKIYIMPFDRNIHIKKNGEHKHRCGAQAIHLCQKVKRKTSVDSLSFIWRIISFWNLLCQIMAPEYRIPPIHI